MDPRGEVAREAARLLYTGAAEEYKQAKEQAGGEDQPASESEKEGGGK